MACGRRTNPHLTAFLTLQTIPVYPGYIPDRPSALNLLADLKKNNGPNDGGVVVENFYCFSHGSVLGLADGKDTLVAYLYSTEVALGLGNYYVPRTGIQLAHPYRFVFLDGCETATSVLWPQAFGIPARITVTDLTSAPSVYFDHPQAFVGWRTKVPFAQGQEWDDYGKTLELFFENWMLGYPLAQCIYVASDRNSLDPVTGQKLKRPLPVEKNRDLWANIGGIPQRIDYLPLSYGILKVFGYVGITANGYDPNY